MIRVVKPRIWDFEVLSGPLEEPDTWSQKAFANAEWQNVGKAGIIAGVPKDIPLDESVMRMWDNNYMASLRFVQVRHKLQMTKGNDPEHLRNKIGKELTGRSTRYVDPTKTFDGDLGDCYDVILPWHILRILKKYGISTEFYQKCLQLKVPLVQLKDKMENETDSYILSLFTQTIHLSVKRYDALIKNGFPRESARYVLPFNIAEAQYTVQVSLDYIKNFVGQRTCVRASPEMRCLGAQYYFNTVELFPQLRGHLGCNGIIKGVCPESNVTGYRIGEPNERTCPFRKYSSRRISSVYIPTMDELKRGFVGSNDWDKIIGVYEDMNRRFAQWEG